MRSVSLLKYLSKSVHFFTAFAYLFTFLGPSLALATSTITYTETVQEEQIVRTQHSLPPSSLNTVSSGGAETQTVLPPLRLDTREAYKRYDLSVTPENSSIRQGIHFHFQNYDSPEESLGTFVNFNGPFPFSNFSPLIQKDRQTGFTASLPGFGLIQCDWQGNLKLVGLHTTHPETPALALNLVTSGTVELSDVTLENLSLKAKKATFLKNIKIQEESVFDIKVLDLARSGFENTKRMTFLSKTRFVSQDIWRNKGGIVGEKSLFFNNTYFSNLSSVHSKRYLRLISDYFANYHGTFHGDLGTTVRAKSGFYNNYGGKITSGGLTRVAFFMANGNDLGDIRGQKIILEDLSGAEHFTLKDGNVTAQERITLVGNSPTMPNVRFVTPQLVLDADGFDLGEQNDVDRTLIMRSKDQDFTLTKDYKTDGTLEVWQRDLYTRDAVQEAMDERFGDETGQMPAPDSVIDLQASIKAAGGLAFFTPSAKVRLGDAAKEDLLEFTSQNGWLEAYATLFDLEKGTLVAENAHVHAPGGILTGRLDKDENEDLFSEELYTQNGSTFLVRGTATLKGPWHHRGDFLSSFLILDSPKDHLFEAATGRVLQDCELKGGGDLHLKRRTSEFRLLANSSYNYAATASFTSNRSTVSMFRIFDTLNANDSIIYNMGCLFHAHKIAQENPVKSSDFYGIITAPQQNPFGRSHCLPLMVQNKFHFIEKISSDIHCFSKPTCGSVAYLFNAIFDAFNTKFRRTYPAQTSFGTGTAVTPDENGITRIGGDFQASAILVLIGQGLAEVGSVPTLSLQTTHTHSPLQPLGPETFNLTVLTMSENLRRLMNQNPEVDTFFRFTPRFWFEPDEAQRFHAELRPFVRVQSPQGGFEALQGQALFTLTPDMLIKAVQDKALEVLGRGNIEDNRKIDEDQILELHRNFVEYLEETGFAGSDLTGALMDPNSALPWPKKPFICYTSAMNEEGVLELSPVIWLPQEMHKKSGIQTRLLLSIPMGMSFNDLLNYAQNNEMLRGSLQLLLTNNAEMIPQINRLALTYREDNGLGDDDELPPAGPIAFNGNIEADSFMTFNTGTVMNHADVKCQDAVLMSLGGSVVMSSLVERENRGNGNFQDRILAQARLRAGNLIKMFAKQDIVFQGAETISEVSTHILALADILDIPAVLVSQRTEQLSGKYSGTETWMHVHNHVSRHISGGELTNEAGGKQDLHGSHYSADFLNILAHDDIEITDVTDYMSHTFTGEKSGGFKSKKRSESSQRQTSRSSVFESRKAPTNIESHTGNLGLTAPHFTGGHGATLNAPLGEVMIRLGRESFEKTSSSTMTSSTWNKMVQKSEKHLTFSVPSSDGPVKIKALKAIVETIQGKELELLKQLEIIDGELITRALAELHEYDETVVESLGGPAAAVIAIAVSCITAGAAGPVLIGALGQALGSAFAAGFASLASQAAVSLISNQGDLSKVLKDITSSQALRSLATSMVTAGLIAGATDLLNPATSAGEGTASATTQGVAQSTTQSATQSTASLGNAVKATTKAFDIGERIQEGLIRASSETLVNSTIGGQDFEESVLAAARSGIANIAGGFFAHEWGLKYKDVDSQIDYFTHKLVHGIIGAGMGAISDGEALAGFIGGVVGEVVGEAYADTHPEGFNPDAEDYDPDLRDSLKKKGEILTQVSAALAAAFLGENPNVAACTAFNAVHENALSLSHFIDRQTIKDAERAIGETLDQSTTDNVEALAEDFYGTLMNMRELDLTEDQAWDAAFGIAEGIWQHPESLSTQDLNHMVYSTLFNVATSTEPSNSGIQDSENRGGQVFNSVESFLHEHDLPTMKGTYRLGEQFIDYTVDGIQSVGYSGEDIGRDVGAFLTENSSVREFFGDAGYRIGIGVGIGETVLSLVRGGKINRNRGGGIRNQTPYNPHEMRDMLARNNPGRNISSSTLPERGARGTQHLNGRHPESRVVYDQRGFPDFTPHMKYETQLTQRDFVGKPRKSHMRQATRQLRSDIQNGKVDPSQFSTQQLRDINGGKAKIHEFTWHHNERGGRMQLVKEEPHKHSDHVGSIGLGKNKKSEL